MKVILKENVESLGKTGDVIKVSDGYARNFLIPKGLAVAASDKNIEIVGREKETREKQAEKLKKQAEIMREKLNGLTCSIFRKEGEQGKLFGSVTAKDIENALADQGLEVDRKTIVIDEPIKSTGEFTVKIKIYHGVTADITVAVLSETE